MARQKVTRDKIIDEAFRLVDEEGVAKLSMRKLAARLKVDPMSLYNHVENRAAILDGIMDDLIARLELPTDSTDWEAWVWAYANGMLRLAQEHPRAFLVIPERGGPRTTVAVRPFEAGLAAFRRAGFDAVTTAKAFAAIVNVFVPAFALEWAREAARRAEPVEIPLPDLDEFPHMREFTENFADQEASFAFGVETLIAGLWVQLPARRRRPRPSSSKTTRKR